MQRTPVAPVARHLAGIPREVAVDILDENDLQLVGHLVVEVEANRRGTVARLCDLQSQRVLPSRLKLRRIAATIPGARIPGYITDAPPASSTPSATRR